MDPAGVADLLPWGDLGLAGLVMLGIALILTGRLVPRSTVNEMRQERDLRLEDMRAAYLAEVETRKINETQVGELLENSRTTLQVLQALRDRIGSGGER